MKGFIGEALKDYKAVAVRLSFLISIGISTIIYGHLNNYRGRVYHIQTPIDQAIDFNRFFVVPYVIWYIYVGLCFFYYAVRDEKKFFKILITVNIGMLICYVIYYFFPTYVPRPQVYGNDIFAEAVRFIYRRDNPYNCFPSIHVLDSVIMGIYINRDTDFSYKTKMISSITAITIIFSTFFIKQHYVYDAVAASIIAYGLYAAFNYKYILAKFNQKTVVMKMNQE